MSNDRNILGGRELDAFLKSLPAKIERNIMRSALGAGARVIATEAKENVSVRHGDLKKSIRVSTKVKNGVVTATVKAGDAKAWYWRFVEFGTASHWVRVKEGERPWRNTRRGPKQFSIRTLNRVAARGSLVIGGHFVGASIEHPGAKAAPFMRPALDAKAGAAIEAVTAQIRKRLTKEGINAPAPDTEQGAP